MKMKMMIFKVKMHYEKVSDVGKATRILGVVGGHLKERLRNVRLEGEVEEGDAGEHRWDDGNVCEKKGSEKVFVRFYYKTSTTSTYQSSRESPAAGSAAQTHSAS